MSAMTRLLLAALVAIGLSHAALAQVSVDPDPAAPDIEERIRRLNAFQSRSAEDLALPEAPSPGGQTEETAKAYQDTLRAYYDYRQRGYEHRMDVFEWQSFSTKLIFGVVLVLVSLGIYFAAIQFHVGLRRGGESGPAGEAETTELVLSAKEIKVRSPVLGVIVLAISLAFFYLYLVYVYPIETVF